MSGLDAQIRSSVPLLTPEELRAPVLVGLSGGTDSLALLHLLRLWAHETGTSIRAVHVDHGLRPESTDEAARVAAICAAWSVPFDPIRVDVRPAQAVEWRGMEDAAREARYRAFRSVAARHRARILALGHQADDQAETLLLHLVRGAGTTGLGAMRPVRRDDTLFAGTIWRPLLGAPRAAIDAYCRLHGLAPLHDPSNDDRAIRRNLVRHTLLPTIERGFPGAGGALARTAALAGDEDEFLESLVDERWCAVVRVEERLVVIDRDMFRAEHRAIRRRLLRRAWSLLRGTMVGLTAAAVDLAVEAIAAGRTGVRLALPKGIALAIDRREAVVGPAVELDDLLRRRYAGRLPGIETGRVVPVTVGKIALPGGWRIEVEPRGADGQAEDGALVRHIRYALGADGDWTLRGWRPGDRVALSGGGTRKLQDWFVDHHVPGYLRRELVLLARGDRIVWIAGLASFPTRVGGVGGGANADTGGAEWRLRLLRTDGDNGKDDQGSGAGSMRAAGE